MRLISFNVNGIRSISNKTKSGHKKSCSEDLSCLEELCSEYKPDILCFQEIKTSNICDLDFMKKSFPYIYSNHSSEKKGYSGVALLSLYEPICIHKDFSWAPEKVIGNYSSYSFSSEGRIITAEYDKYILVNCYVPNSKSELLRLEERIIWERIMRNYIWWLSGKKKCIVLCGDLNCAHKEIDIRNAKSNIRSPGFSIQERCEFTRLIEDCDLVDSFRVLHPETIKYSYWSNFANARSRNIGWRIDYFLISCKYREYITEADCLNHYHGSDHCPVYLSISL